MRQRKKGSSYITIMILMMFLMIVGGSTVAFTTFDVKMRNTESTRVENLYGAESGLEIATAMINNASDYAVLEAMAAIDESDESAANLATLFEDTYVRALFDANYNHGNQYVFNNQSLIEYALTTQQIPVVKDEVLDFETLNLEGLMNEFELTIELSDESKSYIERIINSSITMNEKEDDEKISFKLVSAYKLDETSAVGENERVVARQFAISVPTLSTSPGNVVPALQDKILTADGTVYLGAKNDVQMMNRSESLDVTFVGDVWVQGLLNGEAPSIENTSYDKYQSGILIEDAEVEFVGNVVTKESISLFNKVDLEMEYGNVYARNMYVGKRDLGSVSRGFEVEIGDDDDETSKADELRDDDDDDKEYVGGELILNNDLVVNVSPNSQRDGDKIEINKFYGIEDKNFTKEQLNSEAELETLATSSSAIIINEAGPRIEVKTEAYIGGLAIVDTKGEKYQTGESVSVKPNYLTYSTILPGYEDSVTLKYYNPLMLLNTMNGEEITSSDKSAYFMEAVKQDLELLTGNVKLPTNTKAIGVYVDKNGDFQAPNLDIETEVRIKEEKTAEFNKEVKHMGADVANPDVELTVAKMFKESWQDQKEVIDNKVILNSNPRVDIMLTPDSIKFVDTYTKQVTDTYSLVRDDDEIEKEIFLVTRGDVYVTESTTRDDDEIEFTGNFIVGGDFIVEPSVKDIELIYNESVTNRILTDYKEELSKVFNEEIDGSKPNEGVTPDGDYSSQNLVKAGHWTLEK